MKPRIAINGFGRIGRTALRVIFEYNKDVEVVAVNDLTSPENLAYLLEYDSVFGRFNHPVAFGKDFLVVAGKKIKVLAEKDPAALPWKEMNIDVVLECTGFFTKGPDARKHIDAGAKQVIISAPTSSPEVPTIVLGVNDKKYKSSMQVIANASCTTNCVSPVMAVLEAHFGIVKAMMSTVHSYTATQSLVDGPNKHDARSGRAAAYNIVPHTTGAAEAVIKTLPELEGKFDGMAMRVPTIDVSISDFTALLKKKTTVEELNDVFKEATQNPIYKNVLAVTDKPLVSRDFVKDPHSAIVDLALTKVVDGDLVKVVAWYDNEWGYSTRLVEQAEEIGKKINA